ncbi:MAG: hypothetical protein CMH90_05040 [Oceanicaulis sp.]|uniref:hypothetical protein n=1 Tax=Oceanicaulis sp. UBA2681 TaxID=1947007 RepID=UPI000C09B0EE|nr:hypothetical protein [Oceanicaulis sp. UBA2681]MAP48831.1 hypothetical protein [Oceanicaulis sp.]|tara:strand:+ start:6708 stop:7133 length:426 start_codon:yes stop_codon:yes gene_type:complete
MPFSTRIDHPQRLIVFLNTGQLIRDDLDRVLTLFRNPQFPASYDLLTLFDADVSADIDHTTLVDHAIERQRTLQERAPEHAIRSAFVDVPAGLKPMLELWPLFFPDSQGDLSIRLFDAMDEALAWLERRPIDHDSLPLFQP